MVRSLGTWCALLHKSYNMRNKMTESVIFLGAKAECDNEVEFTHLSGSAHSDWVIRPTSPHPVGLLRLRVKHAKVLQKWSCWPDSLLPTSPKRGLSNPLGWEPKTPPHSKCNFSLVVSAVPVSDCAGCSLLGEKGAEKYSTQLFSCKGLMSGCP